MQIVPSLVEDESLILLDVENSLVEAGFEIISSHTGSGAIAAFNRDAERIAALVSDVRLGDAPTGWESPAT